MSIRRISRVLIATVAFGAAAATAQTASTDITAGLQWRLLGPFRAGWSTVAAGNPAQPDTFYFGAAGGGVWKTSDAGATWHPVFDGVNAANIGALAVAPSDANVIYVGTGQVTSRYDITSGDGVYKSTDAGKSWQHVGLEATRAIGSIAVDPRDANNVLVAAFGHAFGANPERGVFRSADGGRTWTRTLFVDDATGAVDLALDPGNPDVVFASVWRARYWPWLHYFMSEESTQSGVYKSSDGGRTWQRVGGGGWPASKLGRIGVAAAHVGGATRVYAAVAAEEGGGLYRSDDGGKNWLYVNHDKGLANGYFAQLTVAPDDADTVYVMNRSISRCDQGGSHCAIFKGSPGGDDYHQMWINPQRGDHMVVASDQGTAVSVNRGASWSDWYNQPTGQFYHLAADNRFPYWVYSGQQDSGTAAVSTRSDYGALSFRDWHPVGADERDYDVPDPQDPDIVYGSGLGGRLSRWDARTGEAQNVTPWPVSSYGARPTDFKYRYSWITPIAVSPLPPYPLYQGAQMLFRSLDRGSSWTLVSPDLSAKSPTAKNCAGDLAPPAARDCGYGVIWSIGLSPRDNDEIWIGTDDGLIQRTHDGGAHWENLTPKSVPAWAKVAMIDVSAAAKGSVYAAIDNHRQDDFAPHVLRTRDDGKTWTEVDTGLPPRSFVDVVRADPKQAGLLYAGTDLGVFVSFDDGDHWQPLQRNLPPAWVRDLLVHGDDLIAATQGRAIWLLDNVTPLRQRARVAKASAAVLFEPATAVRLRGSQNKDTPPPADTALGQNPPTGAMIDYWLPREARKVTLEIRDASGKAVRTFASDAADDAPNAERYFHNAWTQPPARLSRSAGAHRFVWNLRAPRPRAMHYDYGIAAVYGVGVPITPEGMLLPPGDYQLTLDADGARSQATLHVVADPRRALDAHALGDALAFAAEIAQALERNFIAYGEMNAVDEQIAAIEKESVPPALATAIGDYKQASKPLHAGEGDTSENLAAIGELLSGLATDVEGSDRAPTQPQHGVLAASNERMQRAAAHWEQVKRTQLSALDMALKSAGKPPISVPAPDQIHLDRAPESKELP